MTMIYESENFFVEAVEKPHVDRDDGGHIKIYPKVRIRDRQQLSPKQAIELMKLTIIVGQAMTKIMNEHGVDIGRINYQDNGNWSVFKPEGPICIFIYMAEQKAPRPINMDKHVFSLIERKSLNITKISNRLIKSVGFKPESSLEAK